jgi:uncharacterized Zn finger protein (UPF0148 family)
MGGTNSECDFLVNGKWVVRHCGRERSPDSDGTVRCPGCGRVLRKEAPRKEEK